MRTIALIFFYCYCNSELKTLFNLQNTAYIRIMVTPHLRNLDRYFIMFKFAK